VSTNDTVILVARYFNINVTYFLSLRLITAQRRVADEKKKKSQKEVYRQLAVVADEDGR